MSKELTLEEIDMIRGIIRFYLTEQSFPSDGKLYQEVQSLYDSVSSLIPNKSLGE